MSAQPKEENNHYTSSDQLNDMDKKEIFFGAISETMTSKYQLKAALIVCEMFPPLKIFDGLYSTTNPSSVPIHNSPSWSTAMLRT